jgi:hypothetical protein
MMDQVNTKTNDVNASDVRTSTDNNHNSNNHNDNNNKLYLWNLLAYILNVAVTYIVGLGFLNLPSNGELSLKYQTLVTPVGWAFAIWGVIFTLQGIWVLLPLFASQHQQQRHNTTWITAVGYNYVYVCLAQAAWTLTFTTEQIALSCVSMLLILWFLIRLVRQLLPLATQHQYTVRQYTLRVAPFTTHAAWILAATFINLNVLLVAHKVTAVVQLSAAVVSLLVLLKTAVYFLWRQEGGDAVIPSVLTWALLGIYVELGSPADSIVATFTATEIDLIRYAAASGAIIIAVGVVVRTVRTVAGASRQDATNTEEGSYLRAHE